MLRKINVINSDQSWITKPTLKVPDVNSFGINLNNQLIPSQFFRHSSDTEDLIRDRTNFYTIVGKKLYFLDLKFFFI